MIDRTLNYVISILAILKGQYPQVLWSILLVGKLLQTFGFCIITVAQLHVCRHVLLDVRGIVCVLEVFVKLRELKLAL